VGAGVLWGADGTHSNYCRNPVISGNALGESIWCATSSTAVDYEYCEPLTKYASPAHPAVIGSDSAGQTWLIDKIGDIYSQIDNHWLYQGSNAVKFAFGSLVARTAAAYPYNYRTMWILNAYG
jgi:hypothetical protein